ncbi:MAG: RecX family transcriptional regulator [Bacteroidales bacterium]|nr:RecX family transcriptional regulator [Bacteroidales bacterium]
MEELLEKMRKYCAYQERSILEVREKLKPSTLPQDKIDIIIQRLVNDDFINEERFTECFVRGKFKTKQWGKNKIRQHLFLKGIDATTANKHLSSDIDENEYFEVLKAQIDKYIKIIDASTENGLAKLFRHFTSKGYEYDNIKKALKAEN